MLKRLGEERLDFLDQIRALAITMVALSHYHEYWLPGGGIGVGLFFALSGFLIATLLLEVRVYNARAVAKFLLRRFARIYPAYLCAIGATTLLIAWKNPAQLQAALAALPGLLTFTRLPAWIGMSFGVLWTLQIEMCFYVTLPLVLLLFGRGRGLPLYCGVTIAAWIILMDFHISAPPQFFWIPALSLGTLASLAWKSGALEKIRGASTPLLLLGLLGTAALLPIPPDPYRLWICEIMAASLCGCAMIIAFILNPRLPVFRAAAFVGRISYSLYLVHAIVLDFFVPPIHLLALTVYLACLFGISIPSYYLIERPGIAGGKRLSALLFGA